MCTLLCVSWWQSCNFNLQPLLYPNLTRGRKHPVKIWDHSPNAASRAGELLPYGDRTECGECWS